MKASFSFALATAAALSTASASSFCSPKNGCKTACGRNTLVPDSQWAWHGDGQDAWIGNFNCGPDEGKKLASNQDLGGESFGWKCLYIVCN